MTAWDLVLRRERGGVTETREPWVTWRGTTIYGQAGETLGELVTAIYRRGEPAVTVPAGQTSKHEETNGK